MSHYRSKIRIYIFLAWLYTRLRWGIEWTQLRIMTFVPRAEIHTIRHQNMQFGEAHWVHDNGQFTVIGKKPGHDQLLVRQLRPLSEN